MSFHESAVFLQVNSKEVVVQTDENLNLILSFQTEAIQWNSRILKLSYSNFKLFSSNLNGFKHFQLYGLVSL